MAGRAADGRPRHRAARAAATCARYRRSHRGLRAGGPARAADRWLAPEIDTAVELITTGAIVAAAESVTGSLINDAELRALALREQLPTKRTSNMEGARPVRAARGADRTLMGHRGPATHADEQS